MEDDKILLSHIDDCIANTNLESVMTNGYFLDLRQQSLVASHCAKSRDAKCVFYGGYEESERVIPLFLPYYLDFETFEELKTYFQSDEESNPICAIRVKKDNFSKLTHRDYLGALMALGIKREMLGDILINENGADIIVDKKISKYILQEFKSAGRATLNTEILSLNDMKISEITYIQKVISVASLRLDNVIGACYNLSRSDSAAFIESGTVFVNGIQTYKADKRIALGDKLVLRGKGKAIVSEDRGVSKKGRHFLCLNVYA